MKKQFFIIGLMMVFFALPVYATDFVYFDNSGTTYSTAALTGFSTTGAMMDGMTVTADFEDGSHETAVWADSSSISGIASGNGWSLEESGDTFGGTWTLKHDFDDRGAMYSIRIDAGAGNSVFDISWNGFGTNGSASGLTYETTSTESCDVLASYHGLVAISGNAAVGDLYRTLSLSFRAAGDHSIPGFFGRSMTFKADTDNLQFAGDIVPTPEPSTMLLLGFGLMGLAGMRRKIKK